MRHSLLPPALAALRCRLMVAVVLVSLTLPYKSVFPRKWADPWRLALSLGAAEYLEDGYHSAADLVVGRS